jgi:hypothetical protein
MDVRSRGKSGRAADITGTTESDHNGPPPLTGCKIPRYPLTDPCGFVILLHTVP